MGEELLDLFLQGAWSELLDVFMEFGRHLLEFCAFCGTAERHPDSLGLDPDGLDDLRKIFDGSIGKIIAALVVAFARVSSDE